MKKATLILVLFSCSLLPQHLRAQQLTLRKGVIMDSLVVADSIPETFSLFVPTTFETSTAWPVLFVFDMEGKGRQALGMFRKAAETYGYVLATSDNTNDSLSLTENILITNRMFQQVFKILPIQQQRIYTSGFAAGARMAALVPSLIKDVSGVVSLGAPLPNTEILDKKYPFYFLGIVGKGDFNYRDLLESKEVLTRLGFPNHLFVLEGPGEWPDARTLEMAMELLTLNAMEREAIRRDSAFALESYEKVMEAVASDVASQNLYTAYTTLEEVASVYDNHLKVDTLRDKLKSIRKDKRFRAQKRNETNVLFQEALIREDYQYYLEEDIVTYNFNNLGWWNYQMEELAKYERSAKQEERYMGQRLRGYLNALIEDHIDLLLQQKAVDEEALLFLWMLKTLTAPGEYPYYLKIISLSSKYEDYGTALFYLEELLKQGYEDKAVLYSLEHTALLRITPEFNAIVNTYLKDARYDIIPE